MNEVLTVAEIKSKYDSEWVLIEDPQTNDALEVQNYRVLYNSAGDSFSCSSRLTHSYCQRI